MQATARLKFLLMSPRKVRRVIDLIKGKSLDEALKILKFTNKAAAGPLMKTIQSAAANALSEEGTSRLKAEDLTIIRVQVDDGPRAKRVRFRAMGRVYRYKKRLAHLTVVVEGEPKEEAAASKKRGAATKAAVAAGPVTEKTKKVRKTSAIKKIATKAAAGAKAAGKAAGKATTRKTAAKKKPARPDGAQGKAEQSASTDKGEE